ncbi:non-ribosomal peptide synthetase [Bacillus sp. UNC41MFS5]|uniref:non-ribosomal peptide synthetase n=1 Tax=Bacillus sp. UNC41MFS5 TaxID=1449046 RepID=UPI0006908E49|nr:amino acid adenylation domain-containing protein [Bacillus sp. UNC41MFS5]
MLFHKKFGGENMDNTLLKSEEVDSSFPEEIFNRDLNYWKRQLDGDFPELNLPNDNPRIKKSIFEYETYNYTFPKFIFEDIKSLSKQENATPFMVMMAMIKVLLHRYSGEEDIIVGTNISSGNLMAKGTSTNLFLNTLVLRTQIQEHMSFLDALQKVKEVILEAYKHQSVPYSKIVSEITHKKNENRNPFYQVKINLNHIHMSNNEIEELEINKAIDIEKNTDFVDLNFNFTEVQGDLKCSIIYNKNLFREETIIRIKKHFNILIEGVISEPKTQISILPLINDAEKHQLLVEWNKGKVNYPELNIPQLFEEQVKLNPNSIALIFENIEITYRELDIRASKIANYLRNKGINQEQLVAVCLNRSPDMIASFLGVLKAGGAYVPIDPTYPQDRIAYMLEDSGVSIVITTEDMAKLLPRIDATIVCLDKEEEALLAQLEKCVNSSSPKSLAYVMYTSGSTGKPKGVAIEHRGIVRLIKNIDYARIGPKETFINLTPVAFDVSVFEIYGSLLNGGKLVLMNSHKPPFDEIARTIRQNRVTSLCVTPDRLNLLIEDYSNELGSLRQILAAGEALPVWLAQKCVSKLKECILINAYGPTENSVYTTSYHVKEVLPTFSSIPIGRPISDDSVYILDKYMQPVPIGVIGELYLSGVGIAREYFKKPELTSERFPLNPFSDDPDQKLYKTGDLARYLPDGMIEFLGRADDQVKIRGVRIELGEVEKIVSSFPGIRQAVAGTIKAKDGTKELVAYVVMNKDVNFNQQEHRSFAREKLPEFMIPTFFVELEEVPVTPVGKIDRKKLPIPTMGPKRDQITLPRKPIEKKLVQLWETLLDISPIGIRDNFFDLGGNSLLAMRLFSDIEKTFNKRLPVSIIFEEETIENLARLLSSKNQHKQPSSSVVAIQAHGSKAPVFCIHGGGGEVLLYRDLAVELGNDQPVYGLRYSNSENSNNISVESLAEKYVNDIKEIQPTGPYSLLGFCFGAAIAYEMAQKLIEDGEEVALLTLLNFGNPKTVPLEMPLNKKIINKIKILSKMPVKQRALFVKDTIQKVFSNSTPVSNTTENGVEVNKSTITKAIRVYHPKPYPGKILLVYGENYHVYGGNLGWETVEHGRIHVYKVDSKHNSFLKRPNVEMVVKFFKEHLEKEKISIKEQPIKNFFSKLYPIFPIGFLFCKRFLECGNTFL